MIQGLTFREVEERSCCISPSGPGSVPGLLSPCLDVFGCRLGQCQSQCYLALRYSPWILGDSLYQLPPELGTEKITRMMMKIIKMQATNFTGY